MKLLLRLAFAALPLFATPPQNVAAQGTAPVCRKFGFEGRVNGGEEYSRDLGGSLWLKLLPLKENWGWEIEVRPKDTQDDYGFPLNPPFHFGNSQNLGTGYGDTVEHQLKYEHDVFFAVTAGDYDRGFKLYEQYLEPPGNAEPDSAEKFLAALPSLQRALLKLKPLKSDGHRGQGCSVDGVFSNGDHAE
jgi:hypothetical protein